MYTGFKYKGVRYLLQADESFKLMSQNKFWQRFQHIATVLLALGVTIEAVKQFHKIASSPTLNEPITDIRQQIEPSMPSIDVKVTNEGAEAEATNSPTHINNQSRRSVSDHTIEYQKSPAEMSSEQTYQPVTSHVLEPKFILAQAESSESPEQYITAPGSFSVEDAGSGNTFCGGVNEVNACGAEKFEYSPNNQSIGDGNTGVAITAGDGNQTSINVTTPSSRD